MSAWRISSDLAGDDTGEGSATAPLIDLTDLVRPFDEAMEDDLAPIDATGVNQPHTVVERMPRVDDHGTTELIGQRKLTTKGLLLPAFDTFGFGGLSRQAEIIQANLPERRRRRVVGEIRRDRRDGLLPAFLDVTRMETDRVPKEIGLLGRKITVVRPILQVGADGDDALDAHRAAFSHPSSQTAGLEGVFRVTMGVQQAHAVIRLSGDESARPQPCLEKAALPCTLAVCTTG